MSNVEGVVAPPPKEFFNWNEPNMNALMLEGTKKEPVTISAKEILSQPQKFMSDLSITHAICRTVKELVVYEELRQKTGRGRATAIDSEDTLVEATEKQTSTVEVEAPQPKLSLEEELEQLQKRVDLKKSFNNIIIQLDVTKEKDKCFSIKIPADGLADDIKAAIKFAMMKRIQEI